MADTAMTGNELRTVAETAAQLRVSVRTVFQYIADGLLPTVRLPNARATLIEQVQIDALIARYRTAEDLATG